MSIEECMASVEATVTAHGEAIRDHTATIRDAVKDRQRDMESLRRETGETRQSLQALALSVAALGSTQKATVDTLKGISKLVTNDRTRKLRKSGITGAIGGLIVGAGAAVWQWLGS